MRSLKKHCCESMDYWTNYECPEHKDSTDCPDQIILFSTKSDDYGIIVHDGGTSVIEINYCPWCGAKLIE
jgi:hypothetical protein